MSEKQIILPDKSQDIRAENMWPVVGVDFDKQPCTLLLDLGGPDSTKNLIDESTLAELTEFGFYPKDRLHITVLNYDNGDRIIRALSHLPTEDRDAVTHHIKETAESVDWSWLPTGEIYPFRGRTGGNLKIVSLVECPEIVGFFDWVENLLPQAELARHPAHVTILRKPSEINGHPNTTIGGLALGEPLNTLDHLIK